MQSIILQGYIVVPGAELAAVQAELPTHIALTRAEAGCIEFHVTPHPEQACRFDVYEVFVDQAAFMAHQHRVKQSHWGQVTKNVARHYSVTGLQEA
ncbi:MULTISPECIES: putative quinol monooxygenase [Vibrio]|uniref:Antibiotic biosynthesis monooxygenase n=2 Tax=Vibrio TaxID=662 RepID=A0A7X4RU68_9VIBR|nr:MULTISPECIES: antibiotic biosynthesis monooxygenase [Vibrio]MBF9000524.1 antibiotic biosynthesis monooxygenase [Vibrio nitrifigilis]MZI93203.1 antibiotic biosynthesis monooxygenase [Vibrio eleionomae]